MRLAAGTLLLLAACGPDAAQHGTEIAPSTRAPTSTPAAAAAAPPTPARFTVRGRWPTAPRLTWRIEADTSPIGAAAFERAVAAAAATWNATGVVDLQPARDGVAADVTLGFRRGHHGACLPFGPDADVAHSGPVGPGTFVHFDAGRKWVEHGEASDCASIAATALHEFGHVLGLGHSDADDAVMGTAIVRPQQLSRHDRAGLCSLYGGGDDDPGDLQLRHGDGTLAATLRGVAPPEHTDFTVFDATGDGACEVLVWRTDRAGHGALILFQFAAGPVLQRTIGPFPGVVVAGAQVACVCGPGNQRLLVCTAENGVQMVRQFDQHGIPDMPTAAPLAELLRQAVRSRDGDLDGDGQRESVHTLMKAQGGR